MRPHGIGGAGKRPLEADQRQRQAQVIKVQHASQRSGEGVPCRDLGQMRAFQGEEVLHAWQLRDGAGEAAQAKQQQDDAGERQRRPGQAQQRRSQTAHAPCSISAVVVSIFSVKVIHSSSRAGMRCLSSLYSCMALPKASLSE